MDGGNEMATTLKTNRKSRSQAARPAEKSALLPKVSARPIWETVVEIGAQISDEDWEKVPDDSSINFKNYPYGAPVKHA